MNNKVNVVAKFLACSRLGLLILIAGSTGYWLHLHQGSERTVLPAMTMVPVDYFVPPESFSRIQNAKASLVGLCDRFRLEVQARRVADYSPATDSSLSGASLEPHLEVAIRDLERGMQEAEGTGQELGFAQDLFFALKKAGQEDRWVDLYLKALYEYPMHPVVARFALEAVTHGQAVGRKNEVLKGLRHLTAIPFEFDGKVLIQAALHNARSGYELAHFETERLSGRITQ